MSDSSDLFFDTNIVVYAYDVSESQKHEKAAKLLREHLIEGGAYISTQVLQEFFSVVTRKAKIRMEAKEALDRLRKLTALPTVEVSQEMVLEAASESVDHKINFWDALILESALHAGCGTVLSEDMQHGFVYRETVTVENPF